MEKIKFTDKGNYVIMHLEGSVVFFDKDLSELRAKVKEIAEAGKHLLIDFIYAEYIDSFFQGFLIYANSLMLKQGKKLVLYNYNHYIRDTFRITKIDSILMLVNDNLEALKAIGE